MNDDFHVIPMRGAVSDDGRVSVVLMRHFSNGVTLEVGLEFTASWTSDDELTDIYADMFETVNNQIKVQVANLAKLNTQGIAGNSLVPKPDNETDSSDAVVIDIEYIQTEKKDGKTYYKVIGGRFNKYGVRVWLDSSVMSDELRGQIENARPTDTGRINLMNCKASVKMVNNKPTKVMRVWRDDAR